MIWKKTAKSNRLNGKTTNNEMEQKKDGQKGEKIEKNHKKQRRNKHFRFVLVRLSIIWRNVPSMCIHSALWLSFEFTYTHNTRARTPFVRPMQNDIQPRNFGKIAQAFTHFIATTFIDWLLSLFACTMCGFLPCLTYISKYNTLLCSNIPNHTFFDDMSV